MKMDEYKRQAGRLETRMCKEHKEQVYIVGCSVCLAVLCSSCMTPLNRCNHGEF